MLSTNQFRNGNHIDVDARSSRSSSSSTSSRAGWRVRAHKLRRATDGAVIDRTFRAGEKFRFVRTEVRRMQFLYRDGTDAHFMDSESYEQLTIPERTLANALRFMRDSEEVELLYIDGAPADVQLPSAWTWRFPRPSPGIAATPPPGAAPSPRCWRPEPGSRCRCSSTSAIACASTPGRASTSRVPDPPADGPRCTGAQD